jgi:hypothetical protein
VTNVAVLPAVAPGISGEISVRLAPTASNNNGNHFTYLGVMKVERMPVPRRLAPPILQNGQLTLQWTGSGELESAPAISGPWTPVTPVPVPPHTETLVPGANRFFRLKMAP